MLFQIPPAAARRQRTTRYRPRLQKLAAGAMAGDHLLGDCRCHRGPFTAGGSGGPACLRLTHQTPNPPLTAAADLMCGWLAAPGWRTLCLDVLLCATALPSFCLALRSALLAGAGATAQRRGTV